MSDYLSIYCNIFIFIYVRINTGKYIHEYNNIINGYFFFQMGGRGGTISVPFPAGENKPQAFDIVRVQYIHLCYYNRNNEAWRHPAETQRSHNMFEDAIISRGGWRANDVRHEHARLDRYYIAAVYNIIIEYKLHLDEGTARHGTVYIYIYSTLGLYLLL